ncbi:MAG: PPOX class F420-dependent oxidoreductase [Pseudonocardia sp.]|nr:PPOX class F420-dependent oxidoreductase [Pseudonocardia sp.]
MTYTEAERLYLAGQSLGRLTTIDSVGRPQIRPLAFRLNDDGTIDLGGPASARTQRHRNVRGNHRVALLVDDMTPDEPGAIKPGMGRGVEVRGRAELTTTDVPPVNPGWFSRDVIRIHPERILSWHIDPAAPDGAARDVGQESSSD